MQPPLDSDLMRGFLAVAETGNVTQAADRLGRTQSAVSMMIRRLEEALGQSLFDRHPRGVELTARGAQLVPYARRVACLLDEASAALREEPLTGPIRLGIPEEYVQGVLPAALAAFAERHPGVEVSLRCDFSAPQMRALREDRIDLAVVYAANNPDDAEVLRIDPTVWVTSIPHGQHLKRPLPVAIYFSSDWCRDYALHSLERMAIPYREAFECDTTGGFRTAVTNGLAVAPMVRSAIPEGCRELTEEDGFGVIDQARVVLRRNPRAASPVIDAMVETLRAAFAPRAPG